MLKFVLKFRDFFLDALKILGLIAFCLAAVFAVVFPLWKFAVSAPRAYTFSVLFALLAAAIFFAARKILRKKNGS